MELKITYGINEERKCFQARFELLECEKQFQNLSFYVKDYFRDPMSVSMMSAAMLFVHKSEILLGYDWEHLQYRVRESIGRIQSYIRRCTHEEYPVDNIPPEIMVSLT